MQRASIILTAGMCKPSVARFQVIAFIVVSDEPTDATTLDEYGLRFDIEEAFLDEKSGGYQIHISELATPEAAFASSAHSGHRHRSLDEYRRKSRPGGEMALGGCPLGARSELPASIGWRWRWQASQRGWPRFSPFWLDPAPDPLPVLARAP